MSMALLTKWVIRIKGPQEDLVTLILRDNYGTRLDWVSRSAPTIGASPFWQGLRQIFPRVSEFFKVKLRDGSIFRYWLDAWSARGILSVAFPILVVLAQNPNATVGDCWDNVCSPTFEGVVSDQRVREFLIMQQAFVQLRPLSSERDAWEKENAHFSVHRAYKRIQERQRTDGETNIQAI